MEPSATKVLYTCANCNTRGEALKRCSRCRAVYYCNKQCQRTHYAEHKTTCLSKAESEANPMSDAELMAYLEADRKRFASVVERAVMLDRAVADERIRYGKTAWWPVDVQIGGECTSNAHSDACKAQFRDARWMWMTSQFSRNGITWIALKVSHLCKDLRSRSYATLNEGPHQILCWGRTMWWTVPARAGVKPMWLLTPVLRDAVTAFLVIAWHRQGWPRDVVHMVVEWIVNTWRVSLVPPDTPYVCDLGIDKELARSPRVRAARAIE